MPLCAFKDLGKAASNTLNDGYNFDHKLELKSTTANGVTFNSAHTHSSKDGSIASSLNTKFNFDKTDVSVKLETNGKGTLEVTQNNIMDGMKAVLKGSHDGKKQTGNLDLTYKSDMLHGACGVDFYKGPTVNGSFVSGYGDFSFGLQGNFDAAKSSLESYTGAFQYTHSDFILAGKTANQGKENALTFHHNLSNNTQVAGEFNVNTDSNKKLLSVGVLYPYDSNISLKGKVNSDGIMSVHMAQKVKTGFTLKASTQVNLQQMEKNVHKVGFGVILDLK